MPFSWAGQYDRPLIAAHRGCSAAAPENTLAAFALALWSGADAIELDVRLTADGKPVVIHDPFLGRTTDGRGAVARMTYAAIREHSAGNGFAGRYTGERVPLLSEVFQLVDNRMGVNIEIKEPVRRRRRSRYDVVAECLNTAKRYGALKTTMISSFHHAHAIRAKLLAPAVTTGLLCDTIRMMFNLSGRYGRGGSPAAKANRAGASFLLCSASAATGKLISAAHAHGLKAGAYTVNNTRGAQRLAARGIDLLFSDDPAAILEALR